MYTKKNTHTQNDIKDFVLNEIKDKVVTGNGQISKDFSRAL